MPAMPSPSATRDAATVGSCTLAHRGPASPGDARGRPMEHREAGAKTEDDVYRELRRAVARGSEVFLRTPYLTGADGGVHAEGEADIIVADPGRGLLFVEVKGGSPIRLDREGRWWSGRNEISDPFAQATRARHELLRRLTEQEAWVWEKPRAGHAVCFPDVDRDAIDGMLPVEARPEIILDRGDLASPQALAMALERVDRAWPRPVPGLQLTPSQVEAVKDTLRPSVRFGSFLRGDLEEGEADVRAATQEQRWFLDVVSEQRRRVDVAGCAGSGKTLLAAEKARRLAAARYRTLLVCFNQPLATWLGGPGSPIQEFPGRDHLDVLTFHELCVRLGRRAGVLDHDPRPGETVPDGWFDALPAVLVSASAALGPQYHAIVVDEGQDFERTWFDALFGLLHDPAGDVVYVFHDPAQALSHPDGVDDLGLDHFPLARNCRNPRGFHDLAIRFAPNWAASTALRGDGAPPRCEPAAPGDETVAALGGVLRDLRRESIPPWDISVLTGAPLHRSAVWRARQEFVDPLWNGNVRDDGRPAGRAADAVPRLPDDVILCDTIRRFKGLDQKVVILVELDPADQRLDPLLYIGITRAREHLVVIAPPDVCARLR